MRVPSRFSSPSAIALSAAGAALGLCLLVASPMLLSGCGGTSPGGNLVGLGRATPLIKAYKRTRTLDAGAVEETVLQFAPGSGFETLAGTYTVRVLAPRGNGKNDYLSFESGKLAGRVLADGRLEVVFTPNAETRSRATSPTTSTYYFDSNGSVLRGDNRLPIFESIGLAPRGATTLDGTWTGGAGVDGGFQIYDPLTGDPLIDQTTGRPYQPLLGMTILYSFAGTDYLSTTSRISLSLPGIGTFQTDPLTSTDIYSRYDGNIPSEFLGVPYVTSDQLFVIGKGQLPATAPSLPIPGTQFSVPLAGRRFVYEAGVSKDGSGHSVQIGALYVEVLRSEPLFQVLPGAYVNVNVNSAYLLVGTFLLTKGAVPTPTPTPTPTPGGGTVTGGAVDLVYSDVNGTFRTSPSFAGGSISQSITYPSGGTIPTVAIDAVQSAGTGAGNGVERHLVLAYKGVAPTSTQPIPLVAPGATGASLVYSETAPGAGSVTRYYSAKGGTVSLVGVNGNRVTLRVNNATLTGIQPTNDPNPAAAGSFTLNGTLTVTASSL